MKDFNTEVIIYIFLILSSIGFILMGLDKFKARRHKWRIKESILLFYALIGGSIGIIIGMIVFNHKIRNKKFKLGVPIIFLSQIILFLNFFN
ncbi:DUF1294 domain-containing protein [Clostridium sp. D2Q-14]|uniref:DUF1294 domain-containing protein n=1 Tax=Anaeromonas gelatinilytica TaxID=2683194 RepID=UPI00193C3079|nr:DUF1294 domain-containing protein [Anaeromonas gelatinilytica]MBS4534643.1 DUF1294 domain-containing protein [Anaeromonas gelatinilytica]